ncbi:MAG: HEAT repeat domain-containing protein [Candidatus Riflebacteria bacterium]|nr:HEAT repeat domain-containing protein [Candidatus Riflebacteria bacterium]
MRKKILSIVLSGLLLGVIGCFQAEDPYEKDLKSGTPDARKEAATQLGELGTPRALQILQLHEDDPDFTVRDSVRAAIKKINKQIFMK